MEQIAWISRWFILKKYIVKMFLFHNHSRNLIRYNVCTNMLTWCNRWMASFVDTICYVSKIIWQKKSNLMMLVKFWYRLFSNVIICVWFSCLLETGTKFSRLLRQCFFHYLITNRIQNMTSKTTTFKVLLP